MKWISTLLRPLSICIGGVFLLLGLLRVVGFNPGGHVPLDERLLGLLFFPLGAAYFLSNHFLFSEKRIAYAALSVRGLMPLILLVLFLSGFFDPDGRLPYVLMTLVALASLADLVVYGAATREERQW